MSPAVPLKQPKPKKIPDLLQLQIELAWIKPKIWRRILVPASITLGNLHQVLQVTFGWGDYHLHEFDFGGERYGIPDPEFDWEPVRSETRIQLKTALGSMASFKYIYDFGDHWEHRIKVEKKWPGDPELRHRAMLLKAANAAPPEDVGGATLGVDHYFAFGLEHEGTEDRGSARAGARGGRLAGPAFPDADVDIFAVVDLYEYDVGSLGKHRMGLERAADGSPVEIEIVNEDTRYGIANIHG